MLLKKCRNPKYETKFCSIVIISAAVWDDNATPDENYVRPTEREDLSLHDPRIAKILNAVPKYVTVEIG